MYDLTFLSRLDSNALVILEDSKHLQRCVYLCALVSVNQYLAISSFKWRIKRLGNQEGKKKIVFPPI